MPLYETTFITRQDMSKPDVTKLTDSLTEIVTKDGGKIVKNEYWGLRSLAYRIKKSRKGHYVHLGIDAPFAALSEMRRNMGINEEIIRELTVSVDKLDAEPSAIMSQKSGRDDLEFDEFGAPLNPIIPLKD